MDKKTGELLDTYGRKHDYLRIAVSEHCNLRCFYCMPEDGVDFKDKEEYMTREEIVAIAKVFVSNGIKKIRLTGGEPLARKDIAEIIRDLAKLPVTLAITTNGILIDKFVSLFKEVGLNKINISLDSLDSTKNLLITKRDYFSRVMGNIKLLCKHEIYPKVNTVMMKGVNSDEIIPFVELSKKSKLDVRFIEFMPFNGNEWHPEKCMSYEQIMDEIKKHYGEENVVKLEDKYGFTARGFKIKGYQGNFGVISSVSKPFCSGCNRIRLTADGKIKNCLFSSNESDILGPFRRSEDILPIIQECITAKKEMRAGIEKMDWKSKKVTEQNRSMILIGG